MAESVSVLGGPSKIDLRINRGERGPRGHYILNGSQDPNTLEAADFFSAPDEFDYYIVTEPSSSNYLQMYQYIDQGAGLVWVPILKLATNTYSTTRPVPFVSGEATVEIPLSEIGITGTINNGLPQSIDNNFFLDAGSASYFNVQTTISNYNPVAAADPGSGQSLDLFPTIHTHMVSDAYLDTSEGAIKLPIKISAVEVTDTYTIPIDGKSVFVNIFVTLQDPSFMQTYIDDLISGGS